MTDYVFSTRIDDFLIEKNKQNQTSQYPSEDGKQEEEDVVPGAMKIYAKPFIVQADNLTDPTKDPSPPICLDNENSKTLEEKNLSEEVRKKYLELLMVELRNHEPIPTKPESSTLNPGFIEDQNKN